MIALQSALFPDDAPASEPAAPLLAPVRAQRGDLWQLGRHRLLVGDSTNGADVARLMGDTRASFLFADPPYGMGIDTWDKPLPDIAGWLRMARGWLASEAFLMVCSQMPYALDWLVALHAPRSPYRYKDHIAWVKRRVTALGLPLTRSHEDLFIYSVGKQARYLQTKGRYEDVKLPGVLVDTVSLEAIDRHIKDLQCRVDKRGTGRVVSTQRHVSYRKFPTHSERSPELANFTNVWSFLPENNGAGAKASKQHATAKPVALLERAVELCTPPDAITLDPFLGSGTTLIACERTGRTAYGIELEPRYCDIILRRWEQATGQTAILLERAS